MRWKRTSIVDLRLSFLTLRGRAAYWVRRMLRSLACFSLFQILTRQHALWQQGLLNTYFGRFDLVLIPRPPIQLTPAALLIRTAPLLKEEGGTVPSTDIKELADPSNIHCSSARTAFSSNDGPVYVQKIRADDRPK